MEKLTYLKFFLVLLLLLGLFCGGSYLLYDHFTSHFISEMEKEQGMLAERVSDNLQLYLKRVRRTVTAVLNSTTVRAEDVRGLVSSRFKLLWEIYPEIFHLAFVAADGEVYYTGSDGDFMPLGLPLREIYEWQHFEGEFSDEGEDGQIRERLTVLMQYVPELSRVRPVPVIVFSKRVVFQGEYVGTILVPYNFDFMFSSFCRSLALEKSREIVVVDDRGEVAFSSLPGLLAKFFHPAYSLSSAFFPNGRLCRVDDSQLPQVTAALVNGSAFSTNLDILTGGKAVSYLATFKKMSLVKPDWTVMVATPREKTDRLMLGLVLPVIILCVAFILAVVSFAVYMFRRLNRSAQKSAVYQAGLAASGDGVLILDEQGRRLFCNQAYQEIVGETAAAKVGDLFDGGAAGRSKGLPENLFKYLAEHGRWQGVVTYRQGQDSPRVEVSQNFSEIFRNGRKLGYISNLHDISEERRLQREVKIYSEFLHKEVERQTEVIVQAQKMETVGILAAGFAHDFNNLLASMQGNLELIEMMLVSSPEKAGRYVEKVKQIFTQAADLTRQILMFSRKEVGLTEPLHVAELIEAVMVLVPPTLPAEISFVCLEDSGELKLELEKAAVVQAILNIVLNAGDALAEVKTGGQIKIVAKARFIDSYLGRRLNLQDGKWYCEISIADNGCGVAPAMMSHLFDPFFSTKEWTSTKGSGLGLAIAYRTIVNHGGIITVNSELGVGSTFIVYLPVGSESVKMLPAVAGKEGPLQDLKGRFIMVVEDEEILRDSIKVLLELHGARVEAAGDGEAALALLQRFSFDIIILDLVMPKMGGEQFLGEMQARKIKIPVLIMTGTLNEGFRVSKRFPVVMEVLEKPFSQRQLLQFCSSLSLPR
ncbi:MAG: response regulator [Deltaproteobacteria bacterium]|nr:response regulator [Deltaproteobacteria bacterium]